MTDAAVPPIEILGIRAVKRKHDTRESGWPTLEGQVKMVRHQAVGENPDAEALAVAFEPFQVGLPVLVVPEDRPTLIATSDDVINGPLRLQTQRPHHPFHNTGTHG